MTDRVKGFVVALEDDLRDDDAEVIAMAIRALRGVAAVTPSIARGEDYMNRAQVLAGLRAKLLEVLE
jgi:hypothetical protein